MAFRFKQFSVDDSLCSMKIGTDSVLLGAWSNLEYAKTILDVGTGCGLLALMAAQKSNALISAIDIDENACKQAVDNFTYSPWSNRLKCMNLPLEEFTNLHKSTGASSFDHIIANPPFFVNSLKSPNSARNLARHTDDLSFKTLMDCGSSLLQEQGKLSVIIPFEAYEHLEALGHENDLKLSRTLMIIPKEGKMPNRIMMEFIKGITASLQTGNILIRDGRGNYTSDYLKLTEPFYLSLK